MTLKELISEYLQYGKERKHLDSKTCKAYRIDLMQYDTFIESIANFAQQEKVDQFITYLHAHYKPKTIKRKIASLKAFFKYLQYHNLLIENPVDKIDIRFREAKLLPKTIPFQSIQQLLLTIYGSQHNATTQHELNCCIRDVAVIELLFASGMRISELCNLKPTDVDLSSKTIMIYGKGAKERVIQIGNCEVLRALNDYQATFSEEINACQYFFVNRLKRKLSDQSVRYMIKRYAKLAGIAQHITPHMFRHSFATLLLEQDVDIRYIQRMLGHSSISTTEIYTHVSNAKQRDILYQKHPRNLMEMNKG